MLPRPPRSTLFPTRRSSDLSIVLLRRLAQSTTSIKTLVLQKLHLASSDNTRKPRAVWSNPIAWREAKDRKSTRLNSSHANISYAVFCLKKKTTKKKKHRNEH